MFTLSILILNGPLLGGVIFATIFFSGILFFGLMHWHLNLLQEGYFPWYWRATTKSKVEIFVRLSATIISKDTSFAREKMLFIHRSIQLYFPDVNFDYRSSIPFTYRHPIYITSYTKWILRKMSSADRLKLVQYLVALAAIDGTIGTREYHFVKKIAENTQIPLHEVESVIQMHQKLIEEANQIHEHKTEYTSTNDLISILYKFGLAEDATWNEIKNAYRKLAKQCHPDVFNRENLEIRNQKHAEFLELQRQFAVLETRFAG